MTSGFDRRTWLQAAAAGSAASLFPWLSRARAQDAPRRLLLFYTPHGTIFDQWRPKGGETDFILSPILQPLARHRDQLVVIDGVHMTSGTEYYIPHTYMFPVLWTGSPIDTNSALFFRDDHNQNYGWNTGVSIDQRIADMLPQSTPHKTLEFGYQNGTSRPNTRMIYSAPSAPKSPLGRPDRAFDAIFSQLNLDTSEDDANKLRRKSVLDAVLADFRSQRGSLSVDDKRRLDAHATSIEEVQKTLEAQVTCAPPSEPPSFDAQTAIDLQSDLIAASFGCGLTNIASMQVRVADNDNSLYPWVGMTSRGLHTHSHDSSAASQAAMVKVFNWFAARFAHLLDRLAATPDSDGRSVLDNTMVIWGSELGHGWTHSLDNIPFVVAGGGAMGVRTGRYLKFTNTRSNRLLVSAFHAMGLSSVDKYGSLDNGSGPLSGLIA